MRELSDGRVRRDAGEWQAEIEKFEASGLSALAFCRREGLSRAAFTRWRQALRASAAPGGVFVEMPASAPGGARLLAPGEMELVLPGGVFLRWRP